MARCRCKLHSFPRLVHWHFYCRYLRRESFDYDRQRSASMIRPWHRQRRGRYTHLLSCCRRISILFRLLVALDTAYKQNVIFRSSTPSCFYLIPVRLFKYSIKSDSTIWMNWIGHEETYTVLRTMLTRRLTAASAFNDTPVESFVAQKYATSSIFPNSCKSGLWADYVTKTTAENNEDWLTTPTKASSPITQLLRVQETRIGHNSSEQKPGCSWKKNINIRWRASEREDDPLSAHRCIGESASKTNPKWTHRRPINDSNRRGNPHTQTQT